MQANALEVDVEVTKPAAPASKAHKSFHMDAMAFNELARKVHEAEHEIEKSWRRYYRLHDTEASDDEVMDALDAVGRSERCGELREELENALEQRKEFELAQAFQLLIGKELEGNGTSSSSMDNEIWKDCDAAAFEEECVEAKIAMRRLEDELQIGFTSGASEEALGLLEQAAEMGRLDYYRARLISGRKNRDVSTIDSNEAEVESSAQALEDYRSSDKSAAALFKLEQAAYRAELQLARSWRRCCRLQEVDSSEAELAEAEKAHENNMELWGARNDNVRRVCVEKRKLELAHVHQQLIEEAAQQNGSITDIYDHSYTELWYRAALEVEYIEARITMRRAADELRMAFRPGAREEMLSILEKAAEATRLDYYRTRLSSGRRHLDGMDPEGADMLKSIAQAVTEDNGQTALNSSISLSLAKQTHSLDDYREVWNDGEVQSLLSFELQHANVPSCGV